MTYDPAFYDMINQGSLRSARVIVPVIIDLLHPHNVIDFGCGEGAWLSIFAQQGCGIVGIDGPMKMDRLLIAPLSFIQIDIGTEVDIGLRFDLAVCLEVAEHLPESAADQLVANLVRHSDVVLFSAAIPGQGGVGHINEQYPDYWVKRFGVHDYSVSGMLRWQFWDDPDIECWYKQNLMLCVKAGTLHSHLSKLKPLFCLPGSQPLAVIHPTLWESRR